MTIYAEKYRGASDETLQGLTTRALLLLLKRTRVSPMCSCGVSSCTSGPAYDAEFEKAQSDLKARLKTILATREHVPSVSEALMLRRTLANRHEKKTMARPSRRAA